MWLEYSPSWALQAILSALTTLNMAALARTLPGGSGAAQMQMIVQEAIPVALLPCGPVQLTGRTAGLRGLRWEALTPAL